jgi:hypothetical protein
MLLELVTAAEGRTRRLCAGRTPRYGVVDVVGGVCMSSWVPLKLGLLAADV